MKNLLLALMALTIFSCKHKPAHGKLSISQEYNFHSNAYREATINYRDAFFDFTEDYYYKIQQQESDSMYYYYHLWNGDVDLTTLKPLFKQGQLGSTSIGSNSADSANRNVGFGCKTRLIPKKRPKTTSHIYIWEGPAVLDEQVKQNKDYNKFLKIAKRPIKIYEFKGSESLSIAAKTVVLVSKDDKSLFLNRDYVNIPKTTIK